MAAFYIETMDTFASGMTHSYFASAKAIDALYTEGLDLHTAEMLVDLSYMHPGEVISLHIGNDDYQIILK